MNLLSSQNSVNFEIPFSQKKNIHFILTSYIFAIFLLFFAKFSDFLNEVLKDKFLFLGHP